MVYTVILLRYLVAEVFRTMLVIILFFLVVMVSIMFVKYLSQAALGELPLSSAMSLLGTVLPQYIAMLIPIGFFLAIVLVYGKMFADSELLVMFACGLSWWRLSFYTLIPASVLAIAVGVLSLYVMPLMSYYQDNLKAIAVTKSNALSLAGTGRFISLEGGKKIVYVGSAGSDSSVSHNIFIFQQQANNQSRVVLSPTGLMQMGDDGESQSLVLENGHMYEGTPGKLDYELVKFKQYSANLDHPVSSGHGDLSSMSTLSLLKHPNPLKWIELQWRLSLPLALLAITFMGVAISYVRPRRGRYSRLMGAILFFILYFNLITVIKTWMVEGKWPVWLGLWSIAAFFIIYALIRLSVMEGVINVNWRRQQHVEA